MAVHYPDMTEATISSVAVRAALSGIADDPIRRDEVLRECGVSRAVLAGEEFRVPAAAFTRLAKAIIRYTRDEGLGLLPGRIGAGAFAMAGTLAVHCPTIGGALDRIVAFYSLLDCGIRFDFVRDGADATLWLSAEAGRPVRDDVIFEIYLTAFHRFAVWLAGHPLPLRAIKLAGPPRPYEGAYERLFARVPDRAGANDYSMILARHQLDLPVVRSEADFAVFLEQHAGYLFTPMETESEVAAIVRSSVAAHLQSDRRPPALAEIADTLGMSPRKIARQLSADGICFRDMISVVRRDLCIKSVSDTAMPFEDIADQAGYSELSAFSRAFKGWTGFAPTAFRRRGLRRAEHPYDPSPARPLVGRGARE